MGVRRFSNVKIVVGLLGSVEISQELEDESLLSRNQLSPHERRLIAPALHALKSISAMSITLAPIILLLGSLCVNNSGGKSLPRFLTVFGFLSHDAF